MDPASQDPLLAPLPSLGVGPAPVMKGPGRRLVMDPAGCVAVLPSRPSRRGPADPRAYLARSGGRRGWRGGGTQRLRRVDELPSQTPLFSGVAAPVDQKAKRKAMASAFLDEEAEVGVRGRARLFFFGGGGRAAQHRARP